MDDERDNQMDPSFVKEQQNPALLDETRHEGLVSAGVASLGTPAGGGVAGASHSLLAVGTVNAQTTIKTKESNESFKRARKRKKRQEINTIKRERGQSYIEHLEKKVKRLNFTIFRLQRDSLREIMELADRQADWLSGSLFLHGLPPNHLEPKGSQNESGSEPGNAEDVGFWKILGELIKKDESEEEDEEPGLSEESDDDDEDDNSGKDNREVID